MYEVDFIYEFDWRFEFMFVILGLKFNIFNGVVQFSQFNEFRFEIGAIEEFVVYYLDVSCFG